MKRFFIVGVMLLVLVGCSTKNSKDDELEGLKARIATLETDIEKVRNENGVLLDDNLSLRQSLESNGITVITSFKDVIEIKANILRKQEGDDLYRYYIIVTMDDKEHNTPLLITVDDKEQYDDLKIGQTYNLKVYVTTIVEKNNISRFVFSLMS